MNLSFAEHKREQAFQQLYKEYYAPFCLYAKRFIENAETREDIVSDVFVSLWDKIDTLDFDSNTILGYIKMSVKNSCLNFLRHQEYEWNYAENIQKNSPVYETEPDSLYTLDELYKMLYDILEQLPDKYRIVFMENFFEGKTQAEIAEELDISIKSVNRYKQKVLELLREKSRDYLPLFTLLCSLIAHHK